MNFCSVACNVTSLVLAIYPFALRAQSCVPLDGVWKLTPKSSYLGSGLSFNPYYTITGIQLTIRTEQSQIAQEWNFTGPHIQRHTVYKLNPDGVRAATAIANATDFEYIATTAVWQNCTLIVTGLSRLFGLEVSTTNTYVVSENGTTLTILQYGESPISVVDRRLVFTK